ncbi:MAG: bifunctional riboflavin kinase/FAD synthetase [Planctomycetaceae bacterium]
MNVSHGFPADDSHRGGYVAIGNFDGVHCGHQNIVAVLVRRARDADVPAVALTFDPHPARLLRPEDSPPALSTLQRKAELLAGCGVDRVIAYPTTREFLAFSPDDFFQRIVRDELDAKGLVEGPNFCFGKDRAGDIALLRTLCDAAGVLLDVVGPVEVDGRLISSSRIRDAITSGNIACAVTMLGHPYRLQGTVTRGAGRGADLGFPTANLTGTETLLPADGVYAGTTALGGEVLPAAVNIGPNPTFGDDAPKLEVHVVGFDGELYGREISVDLLDRIRDVAQFADAAALRKQLQIDIGTAAGIFAAKKVNGKIHAPLDNGQ